VRAAGDEGTRVTYVIKGLGWAALGVRGGWSDDDDPAAIGGEAGIYAGGWESWQLPCRRKQAVSHPSKVHVDSRQGCSRSERTSKVANAADTGGRKREPRPLAEWLTVAVPDLPVEEEGLTKDLGFRELAWWSDAVWAKLLECSEGGSDARRDVGDVGAIEGGDQGRHAKAPDVDRAWAKVWVSCKPGRVPTQPTGGIDLPWMVGGLQQAGCVLCPQGDRCTIDVREPDAAFTEGQSGDGCGRRRAEGGRAWAAADIAVNGLAKGSEGSGTWDKEGEVVGQHGGEDLTGDVDATKVGEVVA
jgi:hypothetical protein